MYSLEGSERDNYIHKTKALGLTNCLYDIPECEWVDNVTLWPPITFPDLDSYLVNKPGQFTHQSLKAFKSLDAYNFVMSGWVHPLYVLKATSSYRKDNKGTCIIRGKVHM